MLAGLPRQPRRIGLGVPPADFDDRAIGRGRTAIDHWADAGLDAAPIFGGGDLVAHDDEGVRNRHRHQRCRDNSAVLGELAAAAVGERRRLQLHQIGNRQVRGTGQVGIRKRHGTNRCGRGERCSHQPFHPETPHWTPRLVAPVGTAEPRAPRG